MSMLSKKDFVFYEPTKKRWKMLIRCFISFLLILSFVLITVLFSTRYSPKFIPKLASEEAQKPDNPQKFIDELQKDTIYVVGNGPFVVANYGKYGTAIGRKEFAVDKKVILTFDDGPDPVYTPQILDALKKENVKVVFFAIGEQMFKYPEIVKRIINEGHQIGTHTFSHSSGEEDLDHKMSRVGYELDFPQKIIQATTGYKTELFRVPNWGVEDTITVNSLVLSSFALDRGYKVISSTVDSFDWKEKNRLKVIQNSFDPSSSQIILMHDGGGDRSTTVEALPEIIRGYKTLGFEFITVDPLLKDGRSALTKTSFLERSISYIALIPYWLKQNYIKAVDPIFRIGLVAVAVSILITIFLSFLQVVRIFWKRRMKAFKPFISVLVPAYNEKNTIGKTLSSLLKSDYPKFEVVVIDNNSKDKTVQVVRKYLKRNKVRLVGERVQGKYAALNKGIKAAKARFVIVIDADTQVLPETLYNIIQPFRDNRVGAVAGNLKVGNICNLLTSFQSIEYIEGLNLDRRAYDTLSSSLVVPGALGAWRKKVVKEAGGYKNDTLVEDAELCINIQKLGYKVVFEGSAVAYTEAPDNLKSFVKQRIRWTFGIFQVLYKNRDMFFKRKYGLLGLVILPFNLMVLIPLSLLGPFVDLIAIVLLFFVPATIATYFVGFLMIKYVLVIVAFIFAKETKIWLLATLPLYRVYYQAIWYYVLYKSFIKALKGEHMLWNKLKHKGSVKISSRNLSFNFTSRLLSFARK